MIHDFTETIDTATVFIYWKDMYEMQLDPRLEDPRRLRIADGMVIELYKDVYPEIEVKKFKSRVEVRLRKVQSLRWGGVNGKTSSTQENKKEPIIDDEEDTNSAMDLFSKIYQNSGDDVRRAMEKSFYESEGTVLSTDWDQVKSKKITREE